LKHPTKSQASNPCLEQLIQGNIKQVSPRNTPTSDKATKAAKEKWEGWEDTGHCGHPRKGAPKKPRIR